MGQPKDGHHCGCHLFHFSISNSDSPAFSRARVIDHHLEFHPRRLRQHHLPRSDIAEVSIWFKACRGIGMMGFELKLSDNWNSQDALIVARAPFQQPSFGTVATNSTHCEPLQTLILNTWV